MYKTKGKFDLSKDLDRIKQVLADTAYDVRGKATQAISNSIDNMKHSMKASKITLKNRTAKMMVRKPFKTLGIALLSGLFVGFLLRGRKNSHTNSHWGRDKR
jgi:ElaB/YqjD/DUF883 family membrane-anchored ribosome-binding protein